MTEVAGMHPEHLSWGLRGGEVSQTTGVNTYTQQGSEIVQTVRGLRDRICSSCNFDACMLRPTMEATGLIDHGRAC